MLSRDTALDPPRAAGAEPAGEAAAPLRPEGAPPLEAVFLDLGDTLMHVHPDVPTLYAETLAELGVAAGADALSTALVAGEEVYRAAHRSGRPFESSPSEARAFWGEYNRVILDALGAEDTAYLAEELAARFWSPSAWRVFPEVPEVLAALRSRGLRMAIVSNFTESLPTLCRTHRLDGYFDHVVASCAVGSQKPDVGIYREALRLTGANPAATVHVGDNYLADVLGARAAGIDAILLDRSRAGIPGMFDFTYRNGVGGAAAVDCPVVSDLRALIDLQ